MSEVHEWQVITEQHEIKTTCYWMAVHNGRVVWRGLGSQAVDIAYAIVSLNQFNDNTKKLMPDMYQETVDTLQAWKKYGRIPELPFDTLEELID